ncbi:TPA_exp: putative Oxalate/formate antiporter [Trichophyton benhamiae CBS 112371]|nr:TPA_exp: putative Oxalate/formate antiporter [Trichophyton benhamiae CBS 112371]
MRSQSNPIAERADADSHQEGHHNTGHPGHPEQTAGAGCESDSDGPAPATEMKSQDAGARQGLDTLSNEEEREQPLYDEKALPLAGNGLLFQAITRDQDGNSVRLSRTRSSQPSPPADSENLARLGSRMSTDPDGNVYPEGGLEAYLVVFGCFLCLFGSFGLVNTIGTFQAYLSENQLKDYNQSTISWIFGVFSFLIFFGGLQIGPIFDAKGPKGLVLVGSTLVIGSLIALGFCTEYWQIMVVFGVVCAAGTSMVFTPAVANPGHYFFRLRGRATGLAATGGSVGGIVFPLVLDALFTKIGFAWSTRVLALICFVSLGAGLMLVKSRLPRQRATMENIMPDLRILLEPVFACTTLGIFCIEWGLFVPLTYISSYALHYGMPKGLSYQLLAILNVGSFFGRWVPGYISDYTGRFNTMIVTVLMCLLSVSCLWLPANGNTAMTVSFAFIFGFSSGSNIGLTPVCVGQTCKTENYGRYYATAYTVVSFGCLTSIPIGGSILTRNGGEYWGLITWTSCCYFGGLVFFIAARVLRVGWNPFKID